MNQKPINTGNISMHDIFELLGVNITDTVDLSRVSRKNLFDFVNEKIYLSSERAFKISKATNMSIESWLQIQYQLKIWNVNQYEFINVKENSLVKVNK